MTEEQLGAESDSSVARILKMTKYKEGKILCTYPGWVRKRIGKPESQAQFHLLSGRRAEETSLRVLKHHILCI